METWFIVEMVLKTSGEREACSLNDAEAGGFLLWEGKPLLNSYLILNTKIYSKWIKDLPMKIKLFIILEDTPTGIVIIQKM